jgi:uncharacterized protein YceK
MKAILACWSVFLVGCGTFSDAFCGPIDDHVFYRGVRFDIAAVKEGGALTLLAADIPLSALADTFWAPVLAYQQFVYPPRPTLKQMLEAQAAAERFRQVDPSAELDPDTGLSPIPTVPRYARILAPHERLWQMIQSGLELEGVGPDR